MRLQDIIAGMTPGDWYADQNTHIYADLPEAWDADRKAFVREQPCVATAATFNDAVAIALAPQGVKALMLLREFVEWADHRAGHGDKYNTIHARAAVLLKGVEP